jgi:hypothetical protein
MYNQANADSTCAPEISGVLFELNQTINNGGGMYNGAADNTTTTICKPHINGGTIFRQNGAANGGGVANGNYTKP